MASYLALKRFLSSTSLSRSPLRPIVSSAARCFNTNVLRQYDEYADDSDSDIDVVPRSDRSRIPLPDNLYPDVNELLDERAFVSVYREIGAGLRRGWDAKETEDDLLLRVDMPGLGKEDVKISVKQNSLTIKGEGAKESSDEDEGGRRYTSRIDLPDNRFNVDRIKAEMKNGVLKVVVPKMKEGERTDVFNVKIE